tara:strand:+ start:175 stop:366 length:192 start_codon:yes stop_codon:yes gene_type:complete
MEKTIDEKILEMRKDMEKWRQEFAKRDDGCDEELIHQGWVEALDFVIKLKKKKGLVKKYGIQK